MINSDRKKLKEKLRNGDKVFATWTSLGDAQITEAFAHIDVDFVGIDIEHGTISYKEAQRIIAASQSNGVCCLPRIASHNMEMIKRLLDSGADGIIVPMVETAQEVKDIIDWCKYSPVGNRSYGINRAQRYGYDFANYTKNWNDESSLIIQIESIKAVDNIEELLQFDEVDAIMIGPYDMSGSLGIPGQIDHPKIQEAAKKVLNAAKKYGKGRGTQVVDPNAQNLKEAFENDYSFVVLSSDIFLLWKWGEQMNTLIKNEL